MAVVNIAFSGGTESTALLIWALEKGLEVNLCVINVSNKMETFLFELTTTRKIVEIVNKLGYSGHIVNVIGLSKNPYSPPLGMGGYGAPGTVVNSVTQQFAVALGMMDIRRYFIEHHHPATLIGWIKEDTNDHSLNEFDHSAEDYKSLLDLPVLLGRISNSDRTKLSFRAPFWNLSKREILNMIPEPLLDVIIHTGGGEVNYEDDTISYTTYNHKEKEWGNSGIQTPMKKQWSFKLSDIPLEDRAFTGIVRASDFDLPAEYDEIVRSIAVGQSQLYGISGVLESRNVANVRYAAELDHLLKPLRKKTE